jgi:hypothetical protein
MKRPKFPPLEKGKTMLSFIIFTFIISLIIPAFSFSAQTDATNNSLIQLITPQEGAQIIAKKPVVKCIITEPFSLENLLVLFDGVDITGILNITPDGFEYKPIEVLTPGIHTLSITLYMPDGREFQQEFVFSTRHSKSFEEAYSSNELTTIYEAVLEKPEDVESEPYSKIESNFRSQIRLKEKGWEFTLTTNLRYLDQSLPVSSPEKKGLDLIDYLLEGRYRGDKFQFLTEIGDVQVNETENTVQGLARRGGKFSLQYKDLNLSTFVVKSEQVFGYRGGIKDSVGIDGTLDDHIMGVSGEVGLFSNAVSLKTIYVIGGEEDESYFGLWTDSGKRKGNALGLVLKTDFFEQKLTTEAELDFSGFDADTSDEFPSESDKAYKLRVGGYLGDYSYEILYEYMGPDYEVIGNQGLPKDSEGFTLNSGVNFEIHSINLSFSRYNDNVEKDELYPRIYTYQGMVDYTFSKFQSLPISLSYQKLIIDSTMEPALTSPTRSDTDTISGNINYMKDQCNFGFQVGYSIQDDRTSDANDTTTTTYTFTFSYFLAHFSISPGFTFNRSKYRLTGVRTDTYTTNLDIRGDVFNGNVTYGLAGTYNRIRSNDGSTEQDTASTNFEIDYLVGKKFLEFLNPTVGIRGLYNKTNDRVYGGENDELIILLVLSTSMPFSF